MGYHTEKSGNSLRHISHPKMYLAKAIWQLPKDKYKLIFQLKRKQYSFHNHKTCLSTLPCRRKVYVYIQQLHRALSGNS